MSVDSILALMGFALVMSISPGPGNFLLLTSGVNFGFQRSLPLVLGISCGFLLIVFLVGIGLGQILKTFPLIYSVLKFICAGYVLWMAWKISRSRSASEGSGDDMADPISFLQAALFQWVNPKAWAVALIVTVSYTTPDQYLISLIMIIAIFAAVNIPAISVWALGGVLFARIIGEGQKVVIFNRLMAVLLVGSMMPVLIDFGG